MTETKQNWNGFLPPHPCKHCGNTLRGQDSGYPAELYLGTYTGLCYPCTSAPVWLMGSYDTGAVRYSYAPECPSWRRDRQEYIAFVDCNVCMGRGYVTLCNTSPFAVSHRQYCNTCWDRHYADEREYHRQWDEERAIRAEIEALNKKYSGRKWAKVNAEDYLQHADAVRYRDLVKRLWAMPVPKQPAPSVFTPVATPAVPQVDRPAEQP